MGGLFGKAGIHKMFGHFDSSRPKTSDFDNLVNRGKGMSKKERADFLKREAAKEPTEGGLSANTPLSSRYA